MRISLVLVVALIALAPAAGWANAAAQCEHLERQIAHFEAQVERAQQSGNELWEDRFAGQLDDLEDQYASCPGDSDVLLAAQQRRELEEWTHLAARCENIHLQIAHFEAQAKRADELGNDVWKDRFGDHVADLKSQRKACPGFSDAEVAARQMRELLKLAARGAVTFFTMGMAPF
jgi:hypothetical protein